MKWKKKCLTWEDFLFYNIIFTLLWSRDWMFFTQNQQNNHSLRHSPQITHNIWNCLRQAKTMKTTEDVTLNTTQHNKHKHIAIILQLIDHKNCLCFIISSAPHLQLQGSQVQFDPHLQPPFSAPTPISPPSMWAFTAATPKTRVSVVVFSA